MRCVLWVLYLSSTADLPSVHIIVGVIGTCHSWASIFSDGSLTTERNTKRQQGKRPFQPFEKLSSLISQQSVFTPYIQVMRNYRCSQSARLIYPTAFSFFWEILIHYLKINLKLFTWVGSFTSPFPQLDKTDPPFSFCFVLISTMILSKSMS